MKIADFGELSAGEAAVLKAVCAGEDAVLGEAVPEEAVDAVRVRGEFVRYLALGGCAAHVVPERGVEIEGAFVEGRVDLAFAEVRGRFGLRRSAVPDGIGLAEARVGRVVLNGSRVADVFAQGARVRGDVFLSDGFEAAGAVSLAGAEVGGVVSSIGGKFLATGGDALNVEGVVVRGDVFLSDGFEAAGAVSLAGAQVGGQVACDGGKFLASDGDALNADSMVVTGSVFLSNGFEAAGLVRLASAKVGGVVSCIGGKFLATDGDALNAHSMVVTGSVFLRDGFEAAGVVRLASAQVGGQVSCIGGRFLATGGDALKAQGIVVASDVYLRDGFEARGVVDFNGARIGRLTVHKAVLGAEHGVAFDLSHGRVETVFQWLDVAVTAGAVDVSDARVETLADVPGNWPAEVRMDGFRYGRLLQGLGVTERLGWLAKNSSTDFKPQPYQQLAAVYGELGHRGDRAAVLYEMEKRIRADQRRRVGPVGQAVSWAWQGVTWLIGHGYYPWRAAWTGALLIALTGWAMSCVWWAGDMTPTAAPVLVSAEWKALADCEDCRPGVDWAAHDGPGRDYETFKPYLYAFDVVVPLINVGQEAAWGPSTSRSWLGRWAHWGLPLVKVMGWLITALAASAVTGAIRRD